MESDPLTTPPTKDDLPATPQDVVQPLTRVAIFIVVTLNPSGAGRDAVRSGHPERMEPIFREHMRSDRAQVELAQAKVLARERRVCLLCFEQDPQTCHRRFVAEMISADTGQPIVHLHALR